MKTTINQINLELEEIQQAHLMLHSYYWGSLLDSVMASQITYPLMNCFYPSGTMANNTTPIQLYIEISDKVYKDRSNLNDTESDTLQVCRHIFNIINRSPRWNRIARIESASFSKFWERAADEVAGHTLILSITIFDTNSTCNIPLNDYDMDGEFESSCAPVLIFENDILVDTIPSGGNYFYTSGGGTADVRNSDDSYNVTINSGDTLTLPDTTINVYSNAILQNSVTFATLSNQTINITN